MRYLLCLLALIGLAPGCAPSSATISLGPAPRPVRQAVVLEHDAKARGAIDVAMIDVTGVITAGPAPGLFGPGPGPLDQLVDRLNTAERDDDVGAIIIRINSPGGSVTASDIAFREITGLRARSGKPVVASIAEVGASGGYYIALAADEIIIEPTGVTGSIGVIIPTVNFSGGLARLGIESRAITSGPNKDLANPMTPINEEHYAILQGMVDEYYARFTGLVEDRRPNLSPGDISTVTDGRVVTGQRAVSAGLADQTGGVREAFDRALALAGAPGGRLIKYSSANLEPRTPYSVSAEAPGGDINLLKLENLLGPAGVAGPTAYYLWAPLAP
ncbi:MAG: signal peptide peptidase SppA [Phycisphaerales bacterium JB039]